MLPDALAAEVVIGAWKTVHPPSFLVIVQPEGSLCNIFKRGSTPLEIAAAKIEGVKT
jgi:hypothetical protein